MTLELKTIRELLTGDISSETRQCRFQNAPSGFEYHFLIPSYQRGYRWKELQVKQLLDDFWDFYCSQPADSWYCLQPLVVKSEGGKWVVIDGQQRLTTLYVILKQLKVKNLFTISYEIRDESKDFLEKLKTENKNQQKNPDFFYMQQACNIFAEWYVDDRKKDSRFLEFILYRVKFIWYETEENHYEVFTRLNSGKISLSSAELIKALLLQPDHFEGDTQSIVLQQLEWAGEWDRMEQLLQNDEFWFFISPEPNAQRYQATRLDLIFELCLRRWGIWRNCEAQKNPYHAFVEFNKLNPMGTWKECQRIFRMIKSWHNDRTLYHRIGYLINQKGIGAEEKFKLLTEWLGDTESKTEFLEKLKNQCRKSVFPAENWTELQYGQDNPKLNNILLLFNIALLSRQTSELSRYPFATHQGTAWSLEHIHAKQERKIDKEKDLPEIAKALGLGGEASIEAINEKLASGNDEFAVELVEKDSELRLIDKNQEIHGLENLALLNRSDNSSFNNKLFAEKRAMLVQWETGQARKEYGLPGFIPLATRMVFFKHFTPHSNVPFIWTTEDGEYYLETIKNVVTNWLQVENGKEK